MSKNQNDPIKKLKAQLWNLISGQGNQKKVKEIERIVNIPDDKFTGLISPTQAINEDIPEIDEQGKRKIVVVFKNYNQAECELYKLDATLARSLTSKLKHLTSITIKELPSSGLIRDDVDESGDYQALYNNLGRDVTLKEVKFADE